MHGDIDAAVEQRLLDLLGEQALAAGFRKGRSWIRSPLVEIGTISKALSGRPCAAISRARVSWAWASASALPLVPILVLFPWRAVRDNPAARGLPAPASAEIGMIFGMHDAQRKAFEEISGPAMIEQDAVKVLGIETSCDETAASVVALGRDGRPEILSSIVLSQIDEHAAFGGVVPEIAARAHVEALDGIVAAALAEAKIGLADMDAVAATAGPGLIGGLIVGLMTAKALASAAQQAADRRQPSGRSCTDGAAHRRPRFSLSAAAGLRRAHPDRTGSRRRQLRTLGDNHRRCAWRSVRQDGETDRPAISRRPECREGGAHRRSEAFCLPTSP